MNFQTRLQANDEPVDQRFLDIEKIFASSSLFRSAKLTIDDRKRVSVTNIPFFLELSLDRREIQVTTDQGGTLGRILYIEGSVNHGMYGRDCTEKQAKQRSVALLKMCESVNQWIKYDIELGRILDKINSLPSVQKYVKYF